MVCVYMYMQSTLTCDRLRKPGILSINEISVSYILNSSIIELTCIQVSDRSHTSLWSQSALFAIAPHPQQLRNYGLKVLLCTVDCNRQSSACAPIGPVRFKSTVLRCLQSLAEKRPIPWIFDGEFFYQCVGMGLTFSEIAKNLNIALSTAHRTFSTFERNGTIEPAGRSTSRVDMRILDQRGELYVIGLILDSPTL